MADSTKKKKVLEPSPRGRAGPKAGTQPGRLPQKKRAPTPASKGDKPGQQARVTDGLLRQRTNELAVINSVQAALAAQLDLQGIYDAVGDKLREIFRVDVEIRMVDREAGLWRFPYLTVRGKRCTIAPPISGT